MIRRFSFRIILVVAGIMSSLLLCAQKTSYWKDPQAAYNQAAELFRQAKYGSALSIFDALKEDNNPLSAGSAYYSAVCAARLFHPDAQQRLETFIEDYPQHALVNRAWFELGLQYFNNKDYRKTVESFNKTDYYELDNNQLAEYQFKMGYSYFKLDDLKKARDYFALVKDKPNKYLSPANYYYAYIAYQQKNYETALQHFSKVENDETFRSVTAFYIVQIYSVQGRYDELIAKALPILQGPADKKTAEIARLTGDAYFQKGEYKEALQYFKIYLDSKPSSVSRSDQYEIAFIYYHLGQYQQAANYFQLVAVNQDSLSQNAFYHLGDCFLKLDQKRYAYNAFNSAQKIKADRATGEEALFNYAKLAIELSYNPYNEAVNAVQQYINTYPDSPRIDEAYGYLTDLYMLTKNYRNAMESIKQIKRRNARLDAAYQRISYFRGVELFTDGDYSQALESFRQSRAISGDKAVNAAATYWSGEAYYRLGQWKDAIESFNKFQVTPGASTQPFFNASNYSLGYSYFKNKEYGKAAVAFRKYLGINPSDLKLKGDANLRLGDCNFMTKDYTGAIDAYNKAINLKVPDADYALYQTAMSFGASGLMQDKLNALDRMFKNYPKSVYTDDALYEAGNTLTLINRDNEALAYFKKVVNDHPKSTFVKKSLLKTGLIYFNQNRDEDALQTLRKVVLEYPGTPEAKEALASIKSIYIDMNQVDDFVELTKKIPNADISRSEQDSLTYIAAENQYMNGKCDVANASLSKYINKYPEGAFIINAYFYRAECDYRSGKNTEALEGYRFVLSQERSRFTANAAMRAARINYLNKNWEAALENYIRLEETADQPNQITDATAGQMQCNFLLAKYGLAIQSAQKLLNIQGLQDNLAVQAHLIIAKSAYELKNPELALKEFEETVRLSKNEPGAEAKYMIAQMQFDNQKFNDAEKTLFALSDDYASYDYWVAKGFILLADVYVKKDNTFQAKQTLQSIIDNYEGADLVMIARDKLNAIKELEKNKSK